ncbi:hypothetical protein [Krasilnikovia sp. MM14-A1259]|uniref:hypothetical protein n=1 Tax=Krasilnikovia sp. MM14-A1259 TaxID=3373539 RepID=UPI00399C9A1E
MSRERTSDRPRSVRRWWGWAAAAGVAGGAGLVAAHSPVWAVGIGTAAAVLASATEVLRR